MACKSIGMLSVSCKICETDNKERLSLVENMSERADMAPMDKAHAYEYLLIDDDGDYQKVSNQTGVSISQQLKDT